MKSVVWSFVSLCLILVITGCMPTAYKITPIPATDELQESIVSTDRGTFLPKIAIVDVDGMIVNTRESSLFGKGDNPTAVVVEKLRKAAEDPQVKAVVLRINSPGGGVTASDIIYREALKVRMGDEARQLPAKPIVASMLDLAASGGYYIACASNEIVAEPTTVTGSIGVVMLTFNAKGLLDKVGVATDAIKSGPVKDAGSPFRPLMPEERKIFQSMIDEFYGRFVDVVAKARPNLTRQKVCELADGRVYTGCQAQKLGLIDSLEGLEGAISRAKELSGVKSARVVMYHRPTGYQGTIYSSANTPPASAGSQTNVLNVQMPDLMPQGAFMYLWQP